MEKVSYTFVVGSVMYAQVCTHLDIALAINALGRYLSNLGWVIREPLKGL